jgi:hypothetical protein
MAELLIVVMGARLKVDGTASPALLRRIARAIDLGREHGPARYRATRRREQANLALNYLLIKCNIYSYIN